MMKNSTTFLLLLILSAFSSCELLRQTAEDEKIPAESITEKHLEDSESYLTITPLVPIANFPIGPVSSYYSVGGIVDLGNYKNGMLSNTLMYQFPFENSPSAFKQETDHFPIAWQSVYSYPVRKLADNMTERSVALTPDKKTPGRNWHIKANYLFRQAIMARGAVESRVVNYGVSDTIFQNQLGQPADFRVRQTIGLVKLGVSYLRLSHYRSKVTTADNIFRVNEGRRLEVFADIAIGTGATIGNFTTTVLDENLDWVEKTLDPADYLKYNRLGWEIGIVNRKFDKKLGSAMIGFSFGKSPGYFSSGLDAGFILIRASFSLHFWLGREARSMSKGSEQKTLK